ncbi:hypothetical protein M8C21_003907, partial [Ambrosia artemisiifolia]
AVNCIIHLFNSSIKDRATTVQYRSLFLLQADNYDIHLFISSIKEQTPLLTTSPHPFTIPETLTQPHNQPIVLDYNRRNSPDFAPFQDLIERRNWCLSNLRVSTKEAEALRQENVSLQRANSELNKQLSDLQLQAASVSASASAAAAVSLQNYANVSTFSSGDSIVNRFGRMKIGERGPTQKVYVRGKEEEEPLELNVYNQGMSKTELCNKWQQIGACPYGDHCQFAHGIEELRPVIRHPRYKTEVCRMVLAGDPCPYGHRCHFRHALTEEEKLMSRAANQVRDVYIAK